MNTNTLERGKQRGWTMTELLMAVTVSSVLVAGLTVAAYTIQRSFQASKHHVNAQAQQMRLMDYINLDLRRALAVSTSNGKLTVKIPDYYDADGFPRDPVIGKGMATYGSAPKTVEYYRDGTGIYRADSAEKLALATDVSDFQLTFQDFGQSILVKVTFLPKFQLSQKEQENVRQGTAMFSTTLLRNKRQN